MVQVYALKLRSGKFINYTYLVVNRINNEAILIDPAWEYEVVANCINNTGVQVKGILLTHHHQDHVQLAADFARLFLVSVYMSRIEVNYYGFSCLNLKSIKEDHPFTLAGLHILPYHTPGHTKGGTCFQIENHLFTGDTLFIEGCGMCSDAGSDPAEMYQSIQKLKNCISPSVNVYPGHSYGTEPGVTFRHIAIKNIYFHFNDLKAFISFRMRKHQASFPDFK